MNNTPIISFKESVYDKCKEIPKGNISTYKDIAVQLNNQKACQAVGTALSKNPYAPIVPCHRVVNSDGRLGGFFGKTSSESNEIKRKIKLLNDEGITVTNGKIDNFQNIRYVFKIK
jgi:methylated-DNA-[protein]-cysteine S-methyltransferase